MKFINFHPFQFENFDFYNNLSKHYEIPTLSHSSFSLPDYKFGYLPQSRNVPLEYNCAGLLSVSASDILNVEPSQRAILSSINPKFEQHYFDYYCLENHKVCPMQLKLQESLQKRCQFDLNHSQNYDVWDYLEEKKALEINPFLSCIYFVRYLVYVLFRQLLLEKWQSKR